VEKFEQEAADFLGAKHAIGLNSGTDALYLSLKALGNRRGRRGHHHGIYLFCHCRGNRGGWRQAGFC